MEHNSHPGANKFFMAMNYCTVQPDSVPHDLRSLFNRGEKKEKEEEKKEEKKEKEELKEEEKEKEEGEEEGREGNKTK